MPIISSVPSTKPSSSATMSETPVRGAISKVLLSRAELQDAFRNTFSTALLARGLSPDEIRDTDPSRLILILAEWLTQADGWNLAYRLWPEHRDENLNLAVLAISVALISGFTRNPGAMIEYMMKIARPQVYIAKTLSAPSQVKGYADFVGLNTGESLLQVIRKATAWERRTQSGQIDRRLRNGFAAVPAERMDDYNRALVDLYGLSYNGSGIYSKFPVFDRITPPNVEDAINKIESPIAEYLRVIESLRSAKQTANKRYLHYLFNTVLTLSTNVEGATRFATIIPLILVEDRTGKESGFYSLHPLLAVIGEILSIQSKDGVAQADVYRSRVRELLQRLLAKRTYPTPAAADPEPSVASTAKVQDESSFEEPEGPDEEANWDAAGVLLPKDYEGADKLLNILAAWRLGVDKGAKMPEAPVTLVRTWTRFAYSSSNVGDHLKHLKSRYLGVFMHRCAVAFLNALLVETLRGNAGSANSLPAERLTKLTLANPTTSSAVFKANLDQLPVNETESWPWLFWAVFSCPLWGFFLAPRSLTQKGFDQEIYELQQKLWAPWASAAEIEPQDLVKVIYTPERREGDEQRSTSFDNLFDPLNSVYIQGGPPVERSMSPLIPVRQRRTSHRDSKIEAGPLADARTPPSYASGEGRG
jgi:hypothetical protein